MRSRRLLVVSTALAAIAFAIAAGGCGGGAGSSDKLTVLAGSEIKDLEPLLGDIKNHTGVELKLDYVGTIEGTQELVSGHDKHDLAWFSHSKYLDLLQEGGPGRSMPRRRSCSARSFSA